MAVEPTTNADHPEAVALPVLSGIPTARAWLIALAVVVLQLTVLAWGLSVQP